MAWSVEDFRNMHVTYSDLKKVLAVVQIHFPLVEPALIRIGYEYTDCCDIEPSNLVLSSVACNSFIFGVYLVMLSRENATKVVRLMTYNMRSGHCWQNVQPFGNVKGLKSWCQDAQTLRKT